MVAYLQQWEHKLVTRRQWALIEHVVWHALAAMVEVSFQRVTATKLLVAPLTAGCFVGISCVDLSMALAIMRTRKGLSAYFAKKHLGCRGAGGRLRRIPATGYIRRNNWNPAALN